MIYLANALFNNKKSLEAYEKLIELKHDVYIPDVDIELDGRKININAFEQLRKRNPTNPYIIELKKHIVKELTDNIVKSDQILICNDTSEILPDQTILEVAIAWYLNKPIHSYNDIHSTNRELLSAIGNISLKGEINADSMTRKSEEMIRKEVEKLTTVEVLKTRPGGKQKLTIKKED